MATIKREVLHFEDMTHSSSEIKIENALKKMGGIKEIKAVYASSKIYVAFDIEVIDLFEIIKEVERNGYKISHDKVNNHKQIRNSKIINHFNKTICNFLNRIAHQKNIL